MELIQGRNVIVFINDGGNIQIFCGKDCSFSEEKEVIPASTVTSGIWKEFRLRKRSWSASVTGLTKVDNTDGEEDYFTLISEAMAMTQQSIFISFTDTDGNTVTVSGNSWMSDSQITGNVNEFSEAQITFIGEGEYSVSGVTSSGPCTAVGASGSFDPPDGSVGVPYSYTLPLTGTNPKTLGAFSGNPGWMTIDVSSGDLVLGGTPDGAGSFFLDIVINNDCGSIHVIDEVGATIT